MSWHRDNWLFLGLLVVLLAAFMLSVYLPQTSRLRAMREQITELESTIEQSQARAAVMPDIVRQVSAMESQLRDLDQHLAPQNELASFLKDISTTVLEERLRNQVIEPGLPQQFADYSRLPINMEFQCTYGSLVSFLQRVSDMRRLTRIEQMRIVPQRDQPNSLRVQMKMNIYFTES